MFSSNNFSVTVDKAIKLRRHLHENPELSFKEHETSKLIRDMLLNEGIKAEFIGNNLGVTALIKGEKEADKTLALRADIDALPIQETANVSFSSKNPGVMHACGHDIHTATLFGTACLLNSLKNNFAGNIRLIFQPAEEALGGARFVLESGAIDEPQIDAIAALHSWPLVDAGKIGIRFGAFMSSSDKVTLTLKGNGGHAAHPDKVQDLIVAAAQLILALQTIVSRNVPPSSPAVLSITNIDAGNSGNTLPNEVSLYGTMRTQSFETRKLIKERIEKISTSIASAFDLECNVEIKEACPPLINDTTLLEKFEASSIQAIGQENIVYLDEASMGSEDFALYLQKIPGFLFRIGTGDENPDSRRPLHSSSIIFNEEAIPTGIKAFTAFALDFLK